MPSAPHFLLALIHLTNLGLFHFTLLLATNIFSNRQTNFSSQYQRPLSNICNIFPLILYDLWGGEWGVFTKHATDTQYQTVVGSLENVMLLKQFRCIQIPFEWANGEEIADVCKEILLQSNRSSTTGKSLAQSVRAYPAIVVYIHPVRVRDCDCIGEGDRRRCCCCCCCRSAPSSCHDGRASQAPQLLRATPRFRCQQRYADRSVSIQARPGDAGSSAGR